MAKLPGELAGWKPGWLVCTPLKQFICLMHLPRGWITLKTTRGAGHRTERGARWRGGPALGAGRGARVTAVRVKPLGIADNLSDWLSRHPATLLDEHVLTEWRAVSLLGCLAGWLFRCQAKTIASWLAGWLAGMLANCIWGRSLAGFMSPFMREPLLQLSWGL